MVNIHMSDIHHIYNRLLTELLSIQGFSSKRTSAIDDLCGFNNLAMLDKELLQYIETGIAEFSDDWPKCLVPMRDEFVKDEDPFLLRSLRTILVFGYKAKHTYDNEQLAKSIQSFVNSQDEVRAWDPSRLSAMASRVLNLARCYCSDVLLHASWDTIPSHGPGAVFDRNYNKGIWSKWFTTIEAVYPYYKYFYCASDWSLNVTPPEVSSRIECRLVAVPKDSRGPRLICVHPTEAVWSQQMARKALERAMSCGQRRRTCPKGLVNFRDQSINANLALASSAHRQYATIDLSEASDRVSDRLVQELLGPKYYRYFGCSRSESILYNGKTIVDNIPCYAPMGNATTFPIESLVFWSICTAIYQVLDCESNLPCYVFGDDIIMPNKCVPQAIELLQEFGCKPNTRKSFHLGAFRESCGTDAYRGVDVTPIKWKASYDIVTTTDIQAACDLQKRLYVSRLYDTSSLLSSIIAKRMRELKLHYGVSNDRTCTALVEYTENASTLWRSAVFNRDLQRWELPCTCLATVDRSVYPDGWNHLLRSLTSLESEGSGLVSRAKDSRLFAKESWSVLDLCPAR